MPNIALLNYCNLNCPYCFANDFIETDEQQIMTVENFNKILSFLFAETAFEKIGIIGGEPTLHPHFKDFIEILKKSFNGKITVFTNGIELAKYVDLFNERVNALINVNHPDTMKKEQWEKTHNMLQVFSNESKIEHLKLGINLYPGLKDFDFIINLCKEFNLQTIRCSYVAPTKLFANVNKEEYYFSGKELFLNLAKKCKENNIAIHLDCNHIPYCYFTTAERHYLKDTVSGWHSVCEPVIDITPSLTATSCFGNYSTVFIENFMNFNDLRNFFKITNNMKKKFNNFNETCKRCASFKDLTCQGGGLSFV